MPYLKKLEILKQSAHEKVIYEQIKMPPLVSDRDYTVKITAEHDATNGVIQIRFVAVSDEGPPEQPNYVRVKHIRGGWTPRPPLTVAQMSRISSPVIRAVPFRRGSSMPPRKRRRQIY